MNFDPVASDPIDVDEKFPATNVAVTIENHSARMFGVLLIAQGAGPHPTIVLLHGIPGNERNFDLAQIFRRAGNSVLVFHYRGSWGSEGTYSFIHVLEDVRAALNFLRGRDVRDKYRIDSGKIIPIGHSLGGFAALTTAAADPHIRAVVSIALFDLGAVAREMRANPGYLKDFFEESAQRLQGTSAESLISEIMTNGGAWDLSHKAAALTQRSLLLIDASRDDDAPPALHHWPLVQALREQHARDLKHVTLDADHAFCNKRVALARTIVEWLHKP